MMDRRTFLGILTNGLLAAPLAVEAQQVGKVWRIGRLSSSLPETTRPFWMLFATACESSGGSMAVPVVMVNTAAPVAGGLVANFARLAGNLTGVTGLGRY